MRRKSKFFLPARYLLLIMSGVCIIIMLLSFTLNISGGPLNAAAGYVFVPMQEGINKVGTWISDKAVNLKNLSDVMAENEDLQDDENVIIDMVRQVQEGKDIIYGVRKERKTDTFFKRFTAQAFYKLMQSVDKETVYNHADFRMMTNRTLKALMQYPERNLFLRAIVRQLGFQEGFVYYDRKAREAGESKYPLTKMLSFSIDGITSFSVAPLRFITFVGLLMTLVSFIMIIFALIEHFQGKTIQGWTSLLVSLWFIGGIITTGVGVTGVYIGKIYTEVKRRPRYFIEERV